jgi:hypothetical protein
LVKHCYVTLSRPRKGAIAADPRRETNNAPCLNQKWPQTKSAAPGGAALISSKLAETLAVAALMLLPEVVLVLVALEVLVVAVMVLLEMSLGGRGGGDADSGEAAESDSDCHQGLHWSSPQL